MSASDLLVSGAAELGVVLDDTQAARFAAYEEMLYEANRCMNLTRVPQSEAVARHFLDSLAIAAAVDIRAARRVLDLGTGAGLPGLALAIAFPGASYILMDGTLKKLRFVDSVITALGLRGVSTCHMRAEDAGRSPRHARGYDLVVARAVAPLAKLVTLVLPLVRTGGYGVALKGAEIGPELDEARPVLAALGGRVDRVDEVRVPGLDATRTLVVFGWRRSARASAGIA